MQGDLFGTPQIVAGYSQWFTPPWLARRLTSWVPRGARILEPSCGSGNILEALLRAGHLPVSITAVELDPEWCTHAQARCPGVRIIEGDFRAQPFERDAFDVVVGNFPFEGNMHLAFTRRALELAPVVIGVFPCAFEFTQERDRDLWATRAAVTHRARMPERVDYGGDESPMFESVALRITRRMQPRKPGEQREVFEEVWRPGDKS